MRMNELMKKMDGWIGSERMDLTWLDKRISSPNISNTTSNTKTFHQMELFFKDLIGPMTYFLR